MPIILFLFIFKSIGKIIKGLQTKNKLKKINKFQYRCVPEFSSIQQCNIGMYDYIDNDFIAQLPCSIKHHFHEHCLQQWIIIKWQCPACRKLI